MPKNVLTAFTSINAGTMTGTTVLTGTATNIQFLDNICMMATWTGTPTGTLAVQGSIDQTTWVAITLSPTVAPAGSAASALIDMNQLSFPYIRPVYTNASGTGVLTVKVSGKAV